MGVVTNTVLVPGTPAQVSAYVTDPVKVVELSPDVEEFELSGPLAIGTRVREVRRVLGRRMELTWTVTEYEPDRRIAFNWSGSNVQVTGVATFEAAESGTRISTHNELTARGAYALLLPLIERAIRREERTMFERLRQQLR